MTALPQQMRHIRASGPGGPEVLALDTTAVPTPGPGDILIRVAAAGVNRPDVLQRAGSYPPPPGASPVLGLEAAGTVAALGEGVTQWAVGDRVTALTPGGAYAEYVTAPASNALPVPDGMDMVTAAAVPETFFTVWTNVFQRGRLQPGEWFLVHGGSSGIGSTAIQLARQFGATVITTAGSDEKCAYCRDLGAHHAINYRTEDWAAKVRELTGKRGVDVILDMVGGDYINQNIRSLAIEGRLVNIAFLQGSKAEVDFTPVMIRRLTLTGSTLRPRTPEQKAAIAAELRERVWPLLAAGTVKVHLHSRFPLAQAAEAHRLMETSAHMGKIVLTVDETA